jgi:hypothetical protein
MATTLREFENTLGKVQLIKYDDENVYGVCLETNVDYGTFYTYNYRQDAMATYQFQVDWLIRNAK